MADYARCEPLYRQALEIRREVLGEEHPDYATSLNNLAGLYSSMGDYAHAEPLYRQTLEISRGHLENAALVLSERRQLAMAQMLRYQLDNYIYLALEAKDYAGPLFAEVLAWKGATLVRQRGMRLAAGDASIADQFQKLQRFARQLGTLAQSIPDQPDQQKSWRERVRALTNEKERLEAELSQQSAAFRAAQQEVTFAQLLATLPKDAVLVDYLENRGAERKLVAFLVQHADNEADRVTLFDLGPVAPISEAIDSWRQTFGMSPEGKKAGRLLRETIWEPLLLALNSQLSTLNSPPSTILVSTDGVLGRLPLGALPGREPDTYLLEDHRMAMLPVPQLLPALINSLGQQQLSRELLLLGGVDYDADQSGSKSHKKKAPRRPGDRAGTPGEETTFELLPGTRDEVAAIETLYRDLFEVQSETLLSLSQGEATEARFRELAPQFRHLHLATHGFFASAEIQSAYCAEAMRSVGDRAMQLNRDWAVVGYNPGLLSGLALAGANREPVEDEDDGLLYSQELAFLPLGNVDTAVLSACDTGIGQVAGGEGLLGVQRAFQVAGVRTTVASYWKVDDTVTRFLMSRFYENLWERELPRLDALREAQLYVLNNPDKVRGADPDATASTRLSPEYWAAFGLSGDWR